MSDNISFENEFIRIVRQSQLEHGVTCLWMVGSNKSDYAYLGKISWHGAWRQYTFQPEGRTIFDPKCLRAIADFLDANRQTRK